MPSSGSTIVRFGGFRLDLQSGELWKGSDRTILPDQLLRILRTLVLRPGTLVTRDELRRELWADTYVDFEHGLNQAIKRLREVLGDSAAAPRFIETIPRRGYRFIAAMDEGLELAAEPEPPLASPRNRGFDGLPVFPTGGTSRSRLKWLAGAAVATLLFGAILTRLVPIAGRTSTESDRPPTGRLVRLTSTPGLNVDPALSPDGSLVAYASDRAGEGDLDLWLQPVAGGSPVRITTGPSDEIEPSFSPDGAYIVYAQGETGGIYVVGAVGGEPRLLVRATRAHTPRFSPDGTWVAYWTGLPVGISRAAGASGSVFLVPTAGGSPRPLLPEFATARHPVWSPDGRHLLVLGARDETEVDLDWYFVPVDGGDPVRTGAFEALRQAGALSGQEREADPGGMDHCG